MGLHIDTGEDAPVSTSQPGFSSGPTLFSIPLAVSSFLPLNSPLISLSYLSCIDEDEMWDWTTSILKAQVRGRGGRRARSVVLALPSVLPMPTCANLSPSLQYDDQQPVVLRRRSSSDLARQKFGTMPLLPIRGDDSGATLLSANQTLVRSHPPLKPFLIPACALSTLQKGVVPLLAWGPPFAFSVTLFPTSSC